ncbi:MAG: hypothetical protein K6G31_06180 [Paludibacteraceae bacterium]|nr:hypothetical protein [Paludibacteraceae bacterium]
MKLIKKIERVKDFYLLKGEEVIATEDKVQIGSLSFNLDSKEYIFCRNDVLIKEDRRIKENKNWKQYTYRDGKWNEDHPKYCNFQYFGENLYYSRENDKQAHLSRYSIFDNGKETLFEIKTDSGMFTPKYDKKHDLYLFLEINCQNLLFYTRDLKFLWKYQTEAPDIDIKFNDITIVGDVVIIVRIKHIEGVFDYTYSIVAYNILTGQKLWSNEELDFAPSFHVGINNMLYSACQANGPFFIETVNPNDGTLAEYKISSDFPFSEAYISPNSTALYGNKLYFSIERKKKGLSSIGVVNLDTMTIEEKVELDTYDEGVCLSKAPIVTEDRVYVFIPLLEELHIFER